MVTSLTNGILKKASNKLVGFLSKSSRSTPVKIEDIPMTVVPFIQLINDSQTEQVVGAEVIIRLFDGISYHSYEKMKARNEVGEEINSITIAVMNEVSRTLPKALCNAPLDFYVSFNLYAEQLYDEQLIESINQLRKVFSPSVKVVLEIAESSLPDYDSYLEDIMSELQDLGIQFAIDGFGHTSNSLTFLVYPGFDYLKMDNSFIQIYDGTLIYSRVVKSLVLISTELGMGIIAEGIQSREQKVLLSNCGVVNMQGIFFSRPMPLRQSTLHIWHLLNKEYLFLNRKCNEQKTCIL